MHIDIHQAHYIPVIEGRENNFIFRGPHSLKEKNEFKTNTQNKIQSTRFELRNCTLLNTTFTTKLHDITCIISIKTLIVHKP